MEIFFIPCATLHRRIVYASFVSNFFGIWRNWTIRTERDVDICFISYQSFQDVLLSCHFAVILISYFRDFHPELPCCLSRTGTDYGETFFSRNGLFVVNCHNFTFLDVYCYECQPWGPFTMHKMNETQLHFSEWSTYGWLIRLCDIFTLLPFETLAFDAGFLLAFLVDTLKSKSVNH